MDFPRSLGDLWEKCRVLQGKKTPGRDPGVSKRKRPVADRLPS